MVFERQVPDTYTRNSALEITLHRTAGNMQQQELLPVKKPDCPK
jgi:hypothetical protein